MNTNDLLMDNISLVHEAARQHADKLGRYHLIRDYEQAAAEGFLTAAGKWDPEKGTLATFIWPWMKTYMQRKVDQEVGFTGVTVSTTVVSNPGNHPPVPWVDSLDAYRTEDESGATEYDFIEDIEPGYEQVERDMDAQAAVAGIMAQLTDEERGWMTDWMENMARFGQLDPGILADDWGVSLSTMYNRIGELKSKSVTLGVHYPNGVGETS